MQCLGRLTKEKKNIPVLKFENKPKYGFFTEAQCKNTSTDNELCAQCLARQEKIPELLTKWNGSMQNQSEQLHGLINGEIPEWSRIYGGAYVESKLRIGWTISEETMQILNSVKHKDSNINIVEMEPVIKKQTKKAVKKVPEPVPEAVSEPVVKAVTEAKPKPKVSKKKDSKNVQKILGVVENTLEEEPIVVKIKVKPIEVDGRTVYLCSLNDKVYDTKFNYIGRYNRKNDLIDSSYPDSDSL